MVRNANFGMSNKPQMSSWCDHFLLCVMLMKENMVKKKNPLDVTQHAVILSP